ncbi:MAG: VOC family protein [Proteobacteria bacterium]|nr:VOC family protein [Pseudomonadota bacterium]
MSITRVESLVYGVADLAAGIRYYENWGLKAAERGDNGAVFATPAGQTIHLRPIDDPSLPAAPDGDRSTVRQTVWGVDSADDLEKIGAEMSSDRDVARAADGTLSTVDESGFSIGFALSQPAIVKVEPPRVNLNENGQRLNQTVQDVPQARPLRLGHVVFYIPRDGADRAVSFYIDRLGFRLSDSTVGRGDFMRCAGSRDHHNLFLLQSDNGAAFNHAAFEVRDFDEIMMGGACMKSHGWVPDTTPGRHILGSNLYWYFRNPCGGNTEYFADMDCMDDDWEPRIWQTSPGFSLWSIDDPDQSKSPPAAGM